MTIPLVVCPPGERGPQRGPVSFGRGRGPGLPLQESFAAATSDTAAEKMAVIIARQVIAELMGQIERPCEQRDTVPGSRAAHTPGGLRELNGGLETKTPRWLGRRVDTTA
jgi:hypothetical protein